MANVLWLVRQFHVNKKPIDICGSSVHFDEYALPLTALTNHVIWGTGKNDVPKEYYSLESILYFLRNVHLHHPVYASQGATDGVTTVRRPDRKPLLAYLNGKKGSIPGHAIDTSAPLQVGSLGLREKDVSHY